MKQESAQEAQEIRNRFEAWLSELPTALEEFVAARSSDIDGQLDFSGESLGEVEQWLLSHFSSPEELTAESDRETLDGVARYIGEVFRRELGGEWTIEADDPKYVYYGLPEIRGFRGERTPICPHTLATASLARRTGSYLEMVFGNLVRRASAVSSE